MKQLLLNILKSKHLLVLASLLVLGLAVALPNKPAAASSGNDIINGGAHSAGELCYHYQHNGNIRAIMNHFGINGCTSGLVSGEVRSNGDVYVGGRKVAQYAHSAGRHNIPGSTPVPGLGIYVRPTHVSFNSSSIPALVNMQNGQFKWAVLKDCGNPITARPTTPPPRGRITKTVNKYQVDIDERFDYTIRVTNVGEVNLTNVVIADVLPRGIEPIQPIPHGGTYNPANRKITFPAVSVLRPGQTVTRVFRVLPDAAVQGDVRLKNIACFISDQNRFPLCDDAFVIVRKPSFVCRDLIANPTQGQFPLTVNFRGVSEVRRTQVTGWTFYPGDGTGRIDSNTNQASHTYQTPGEHTAYAVVHTQHGSTRRTADCEVRIRVNEQPQQRFACKDLSAQPSQGQPPLKVRFNATSEVENTQVQKYLYDFGDGSTQEVASNQTSNSVEHTYQNPGEYVANVRVQTAAGTTEVTEACQVKVTVKEKTQPQFVCEDLTANPTSGKFPLNVTFTATEKLSAGVSVDSYILDFGEGESEVVSKSRTVSNLYEQPGTYTATVKVKTTEGITLPNDDCKVTITVLPETPPEETPPEEIVPGAPEELVNTGFGSAIGLGGSGLAFAVRAYIKSRRNLLGSLLISKNPIN